MEHDRHEELLKADRERWARLEAAQTPEELAAAFRSSRRPFPRAAVRRVATAVAGVGLIAAWIALRVLPEVLPRVAGERSAAPAKHSLPSVARPRVPVVNVVPLYGSEAGLSVQVNPRAWPSWEPEWRPDGRALLVMTSKGAVEVPRSSRDRRPDWSRMRVLNEQGAGASYSPSGGHLADLDGSGHARILAPDVGTARRLSLPGNRIPRGVDWSADDRLAIVTRTRLFVTRRSGAVLREIELREEVAFPQWSPDATHLLVTQLRPERTLRVISIEDGTVRPLLRTDDPAAWGSWSPDGRSIAFAKFVEGTWDLFVVDVGSRGERRLTKGGGSETFPAWSPDGRWLAYVTEQR